MSNYETIKSMTSNGLVTFEYARRYDSLEKSLRRVANSIVIDEERFRRYGVPILASLVKSGNTALFGLSQDDTVNSTKSLRKIAEEYFVSYLKGDFQTTSAMSFQLNGFTSLLEAFDSIVVFVVSDYMNQIRKSWLH